MSAPVLYHQNVSFESQRREFFWFDHFWGDQIQDLWAITVNGTGTADVVDGVAGGIARLDNPANGDVAYLHWNSILSLLTDHEVCFEIRARINVTTYHTSYALLMNGLNDRFGLWIQENTGIVDKWRMRGSKAGVTTYISHADDQDTDWHRHRFQAHNHGGQHIHGYVDLVEYPSTLTPTHVTPEYLQPVTYSSFTPSGAAMEMDIDYIGVRM